VADHLADLESDFSVYHRIDDMTSLPVGQFFSRAVRMVAYGGALAASVRRETQPEPSAGPARIPSNPSGGSDDYQALRRAHRLREFAKYARGGMEELDFDTPAGRAALTGVVGVG